MKGPGKAEDLDPRTLLHRALEQLESGREDAAASTLRRLQKLAPGGPEALTLEAYLAAEDDDDDRAWELARRAAEAEPPLYEALVLCATLALDLGDGPDQAAAYVKRALAWARDDDDRAQARLVEIEAHTAAGAEGRARKALAALDALALTDPGLRHEAGAVALELDDPRRARRHLEAAVAADPSFADAWHALGMAHDALGRTADRATAWLRCRALDLAEARPGWHLSAAAFGREAEKALESLPEKLRSKLEGVAVLAADLPSEAQVRDGVDPRLLGLFSGRSVTDVEYSSGQPVEPNVIHLFQRNLEADCGSRTELLEQIRITVLHETAHYLGLEEDDLEALGLD
jgi:predicted Zn-dependent protease with MMP-like domain